MLPLVSIVIPTHNRAELLHEAIESALDQHAAGELFNTEIVVVDDASTDETAEVVASYPGLRYVRLDANRGVSAARNAGIRASTGTYIGLLDDDDLWLPQKLRRQVPVLERHREVGVVYGRFYRRSRRIKTAEVLFPDVRYARSGWVFPFIAGGYTTFHFVSALIRRDAFDTVGDFDERLNICEDFDMLLRLATHFPFRFESDVVAVWRPGEGLSRKAIRESDLVHMRVLETALGRLHEGAREPGSLEIRCRARLGFTAHLASLREFDRLYAYLREGLGAMPGLVEDPHVARELASTAFAVVRAAEVPLQALEQFAAELQALTVPLGDQRRRVTRALLAEVWASGALALGTGIRAYPGDAAYAALRAVRLSRVMLRRKRIMWLIARGLLRDPRTALGGHGAAARS